MRYVSQYGSGWEESRALGNDLTVFPEVLIDDIGADMPTALRLLLMAVANDFGFGSFPLYDDSGKWLSK